MCVQHVVRPGETVARIAREYGFFDWRTIWEHDDNRALADRRKNPDVLAPGDILVVPDKTQKTVAVPTGQKHVFRTIASPLKLRLILRDFGDEPLRNLPCTLSVEGSDLDLETDDEGLLEAAIPPSAERAELRFHDPLVPFELVVPVQIGHLDPVDTLAGQTARLNNLGYPADAIDEADSTRFEYAVQEFQVDHDLAVDGVCGPATQARLEEAHGS